MSGIATRISMSLALSTAVLSTAAAQAAEKILDASAAKISLSGDDYRPMERIIERLRPVALQPLDRATSLDGEPRVITGSPGPAAVAGSVDAPEDGPMAPQNYGEGSLNTINHYTDSVVLNYNSYPYRATGWFTFTASNGSGYRCTAAMVSKSIAITAGHCVHDGGGGNRSWILEGEFTPAYNKGKAPYGSARADSVYTTAGWFNVGALDQGYDVALIVLRKAKAKKGGGAKATTYEIGNKTGWYGMCVANCIQSYWYNTQLGYPGNYYGGSRMTQGEHLEYSDGFDYRAGSGMEGGSSGGPHITNLGSISDSAVSGQWPSRNVVFAVTSWGYVNRALKIQGFSTTSGPGNVNDFVGMWNRACTRARALHGRKTCDLL